MKNEEKIVKKFKKYFSIQNGVLCLAWKKQWVIAKEIDVEIYIKNLVAQVRKDTLVEVREIIENKLDGVTSWQTSMSSAQGLSEALNLIKRIESEVL